MTALEAVVAARGRLDRLVVAAFDGVSRSRAAALIRQGAVRVDGVVLHKPAAVVPPGAKIELDLPEPVADRALPQDLPVSIVYQDDHLAVIDKAAGMVVHPSAGHDDGTLVNALLFHLDGLASIGGVQRPGIVHRLDRGTSGLMVVAKNDAAHAGLSAQFADHSAGRRYVAVVHGVPSSSAGVIRSLIARHPHDRKRFASTTGGHGKAAVTHWRRLAQAGAFSVVECRLETGRTHQVRVHLTDLGHPLVGDWVYKRKAKKLPPLLQDLVAAGRPLLHAWQLDLTHPQTGESLKFTSDVPQDMQHVLRALDIDVPSRDAEWV